MSQVDLPVIVSPLLAALPGVRHAFFTRQGGVSQGIYTSLNLGRGSDDDKALVAENRRRAAQHFGLTPDALNCCYQIHSATALLAEAPWGAYLPRGDAVVTSWPSIACGALAADCAPILLADPEARIVASAHAGWKGALGGIVASTVEMMQRHGAKASRIVAAVGPCIGPASYEVGLEFLETFETGAPGSGRFFGEATAPDKRMFDLPAFVLERLREAGVETCEWVGRDTCAEEALFFSNRRAFKRGEADYGRLLSAVMLD